MAERTPPHRLVGQTISHYKLLDILGIGGMGEVYAAEDVSLGRIVAVKVMPADVGRDPERRLRFEREARAVAAINHANIVAIHDFGEHEGVPFVVMERLEGDTLRTQIDAGAIPPSKAAAYAHQIADALAAAHEKGIIHRDLKPENLFITREGRVKVLDFGLAALAVSPASAGSTVATNAALTAAGMVVGTAGYMAPEQVRGEDVDPRADIFALGAIVYEMVTGRRAFAGASTVETMHAVLAQDPPEVVPGNSTAAALAGIARRCLEKRPSERFQSARDVTFALDAISSASAPHSAPERRPKRILAALVAAAVVVAALAAVVVGRFVARGSAPASSHRRVVVLPFENLGPASDEYFASGLTEELASRLAALKGLEVISRNSSERYAKSKKTTKEIATELGVDYIISGTIRWDRSAGAERVRVIPQLIRATDDTSVWSDRYDRVVAEIFGVQSDIAEKVAGALDVTLLAAERRAIETPPTANLDAYKAYLRGVDLERGADRVTDRITRQVAEAFEEAVRIDPTFALAHARLSQAYSNRFRFGYDRTDERLDAARVEGDRALALSPGLAQGHVALGLYFYTRTEYDQALHELDIAQRDLPGSADVPFELAAVHRRQGRFEEAAAEYKRAAELDPHSPDLPREVATTVAGLGRFSESLAYFDKSIAMAPYQTDAYAQKALIQIALNGDLAAARETLTRMPDTGDQGYAFAWFLQELREGQFADARRRIAAMRFDVITNQAAWQPRALLAAEADYYLGNRSDARTEYDDARRVIEAEVQVRPADARVHAALALAYAGLGRKDDAIREGKRAVDLLGPSKDRLTGPGRVIDLAHVYARVGEPDLAIDLLEQAPIRMSAHSLAADPRWTPLRQHPRWAALLRSR